MAESALITNHASKYIEELDQIDRLLSTQSMIRQFSIQTIQQILDESELPRHVRLRLERGIAALENIADSSLRHNMEIIFNQMCVLAVSALEEKLKSYFLSVITDLRYQTDARKRLGEIKVSLQEVFDSHFRMANEVGPIILSRGGVNFQDFGAICRAFDEYLGKRVELPEEDAQQVCFYLESRHVIVHRGGIVDSRFVANTSKYGANLKSLAEGDPVVLTEQDWVNMKVVLPKLVSAVTAPRK